MFNFFAIKILFLLDEVQSPWEWNSSCIPTKLVVMKMNQWRLSDKCSDRTIRYRRCWVYWSNFFVFLISIDTKYRILITYIHWMLSNSSINFILHSHGDPYEFLEHWAWISAKLLFSIVTSLHMHNANCFQKRNREKVRVQKRWSQINWIEKWMLHFDLYLIFVLISRFSALITHIEVIYLYIFS